MGLTIHREPDVDCSVLLEQSVAVIGYGNQGRAHALNLRDSGVTVHVGQRPGPGFDRALADGFAPLTVADAAAASKLVILTLPDESASDVYAADIDPVLHAGQTIGFVHGFNIRFRLIQPPAHLDVVMIAPKGPGTLLRSLYLEGRGLPALIAVHQDASGQALQTALAWGAAIGSARAGIVETSFESETETDLFGEQVVLCGGINALTKAAFETLVDAGYEPEFAYLECVHELKQVVDLLYARGLRGMREAISNTAAYGDVTRGPRIITDDARLQMKHVLNEIQSGAFAREWIEEFRSGARRFQALLDSQDDQPLERAGARVRALMPWLAASESRDL